LHISGKILQISPQNTTNANQENKKIKNKKDKKYLVNLNWRIQHPEIGPRQRRKKLDCYYKRMFVAV